MINFLNKQRSSVFVPTAHKFTSLPLCPDHCYLLCPHACRLGTRTSDNTAAATGELLPRSY